MISQEFTARPGQQPPPPGRTIKPRRLQPQHRHPSHPQQPLADSKPSLTPRNPNQPKTAHKRNATHSKANGSSDALNIPILDTEVAHLAGLPEIDLHDVRHSYATAGRDAKIDWKALSKRIGHADVAFTMKQYVQTDLEADRQVANTLAELIIGGSLTSFEITGAARETG